MTTEHAPLKRNTFWIVVDAGGMPVEELHQTKRTALSAAGMDFGDRKKHQSPNELIESALRKGVTVRKVKLVEVAI